MNKRLILALLLLFSLHASFVLAVIPRDRGDGRGDNTGRGNLPGRPGGGGQPSAPADNDEDDEQPSMGGDDEDTSPSGGGDEDHAADDNDFGNDDHEDNNNPSSPGGGDVGGGSSNNSDQEEEEDPSAPPPPAPPSTPEEEDGDNDQEDEDDLTPTNWNIAPGTFSRNKPTKGQHTVEFSYDTRDKETVWQIFANPSGPSARQPTAACDTQGGTYIGDFDKVASLGITSIQQQERVRLLGGSYSSWIFKFNNAIGVGNGNSIHTVSRADGKETATINFCIKFGLKEDDDDDDGNDDAAAIHHNFREFAIVATIEFANSYSQLGLRTEPAEIQTTTFSVSHTLYSKVCGRRPPSTFETGDVISICVCTDEYPVTRVSEVMDLKFRNEDYTQQAIQAGTVQSLSEEKGCQKWGNSYCCQVSTLLNTQFYSSENLEVAFEGVADLDIYGGRQRDVRTRNLESPHNEEQTFQGYIKLAAASGAAPGSYYTAASTYLAAAVSLAFLML